MHAAGYGVESSASRCALSEARDREQCEAVVQHNTFQILLEFHTVEAREELTQFLLLTLRRFYLSSNARISSFDQKDIIHC